MQLFHAGVNITLPFFPMTHFGTRLAALERLRTSVKSSNDLGNIELYEVTFDDAELRIIDTEDFDSPKPEAVLRACFPDAHEMRYNIMQQIIATNRRMGIDETQKKATARAMVLDAIAGTCDVLRYVNEREDVGQTSYCILQPRFTTIQSTRAQQISQRSAELGLGDSTATVTLLDRPIVGTNGVPQYSHLSVNPTINKLH